RAGGRKRHVAIGVATLARQSWPVEADENLPGVTVEAIVLRRIAEVRGDAGLDHRILAAGVAAEGRWRLLLRGARRHGRKACNGECAQGARELTLHGGPSMKS